jgi:predicted ATPase
VNDATPQFVGTSTANWRVELLGQVCARRGEQVITQFGSRKVLALLARLAMAPQRAHPREELIDLLWPDADLEIGRNRLRQALATLRRLIEPPGIGDVLLADRQHLRLQAGTVSCDAIEFQSAVARRDWSTALSLYRGELLPGIYDEWVLEERQRLANLAEVAVAARDPGPTMQPIVATTPGAAVRSPATTHLLERQTWAPDRWTQLPSYASQFFGRHLERVALHEAVLGARLVTLKGPGGAGKTRLAAEVVRDLGDEFELAAFVSLSDCADPQDLPARVAAALPMQGSGRDAAAVRQFLSGRRSVLVLDNFEQLVSAEASALLESWMRGLPDLHLVATSRRRLDIEGELVLAVEPLELPDLEATLEECCAAPAVALFVDRARNARPGFALNERNLDDVLAVCRLVEGLPLALELAACRAHAFSMGDIAAQVSRSALDLQRRGARARRDSRHASLRVALAWSWALLSETERQALADLTVFRGGCTLDAAAVVLCDRDATAQIEALVGDALVVAESDSRGRMRYRLYDLVREFATEHAPADAVRGARDRLCRWCLSSLKAQAGDWPTSEVENLYAAMRGALTDGLPELALQIAVAAQWHWRRHGAAPTVLEVWQQALDACDEAQDFDADSARVLRLDARRLLARLCFEAGAGRERALDLAAAAVSEARTLGRADADVLCRSLFTWTSIRWSGEPSSAGLRPALDEALALSAGVSAETRATLLNLAAEVYLIGDDEPVAARAYYEQALQLFRSLRWEREALSVELGLGICAQYERRYMVAREIQLRVAAGAAELDDRMLQIDAENNLCVIATLARNWSAALHHGRRQLALAARWNARYMQSMALWNLAKPLARSRLPQAAAQVLAFAADDWVRHYGQLRARDRRYMVKVHRLVRFQIGAACTAASQAAGLGMSMGQATRLAQEATHEMCSASRHSRPTPKRSRN